MLQVTGLEKSFGSFKVLKDITFRIDDGEVGVIIGPSGTGKSTLLRCINFIEKPDGGSIKIGDLSVDAGRSPERQIRRLRNKTAMVFQNYCLFKNKTVLENIMMPLVLVQKKKRETALEIALQLLEQVGLKDKQHCYPSRLSGGQQQRVGIARALAVNPEIILFDEPTSSLDPERVGEVLAIIKDLADKKRCSMLIVTHEMNFAMEISDKVFFMDDGMMTDEGAPDNLRGNSANKKLWSFLNGFIR